MMTLQYGPAPSNVGDLYLPRREAPPVVALLHGGFWRMPYGRDQMAPVAEDLCRLGFAVWNVEYRRLGEPKVRWPEIAADVVSALAWLESFSDRQHPLDLQRATIVGHSAGGQLALACTSARVSVDRRYGPRLRFRPAAVVGLAAVTNLEAAFAANLGDGAVHALLGGGPSDRPEQYAEASPLRLLPHGSRQLLIHGTADDAVPITQSRDYVYAARGARDRVSCIELPGGGHMDFLDPRSAPHDALCEWLLDATSVPPSGSTAGARAREEGCDV